MPNNVGKLKEIIVKLRDDNDRYQALYGNSEARVTILEERISMLEAKLFAPTSEKLILAAKLMAHNQPSLFDLLDEHLEPIAVEPEENEVVEIPAHARKKNWSQTSS